MKPPLRKLALTAHITASLGWLGAVAGFLSLAVIGMNSSKPQEVMAGYMAIRPLTLFVIVPLAVASLLSGLVSSLTTPFGLFRHYWVSAKLFLTIVAIAVLLLKIEPIFVVSAAAELGSAIPDDLARARKSLLVHAMGGIAILLVNTTLGVYKPWGLTAYGLRMRRTARAAAVRALPAHPGSAPRSSAPGPSSERRASRAYVALGIAILLVALIVAHFMGGGARLH